MLILTPTDHSSIFLRPKPLHLSRQNSEHFLPCPSDPYSFSFLLLCLPSVHYSLSLPLSLSVSRSTRSLFVIHPRSIRLSACPSIWISNLRIFPMLFDDSVSLCHCRSWDLEVGQPNHRRSVFLEARKKKKKERPKKKKKEEKSK